MGELFLARENLIFSTALALMLLIGVAELLGLLFGQSLSEGVESLLPEADVELHAHPEFVNTDSDTALSRLLGWLRIGQVPLLMLLVVFLLSFGLIGLLLQRVLLVFTSNYLPGLFVAVPAFVMTLPCMRVLGGLLEKVMPRDETTAVSADTLIGRMAQITLGTARATTPAEAKVTDQHGYVHYVRLVPEDPELEFAQGARVLLTSRSSGVYTAIESPSPTLNEP